MTENVEFLVGLLDQEGPADVAAEDFIGENGPTLRICQEMGFLSEEPWANPIPNCPYCCEGVPYRLGTRHLCNCCHSTVDRRHLFLWRLDLGAFLRWLALQLGLRGSVQQIDNCIWQLGTWQSEGTVREVFYRRSGLLSGTGQNRLSVYRSAVVVFGAVRPQEAGNRVSAIYVSLLEMLRLGDSLTVMNPEKLLHNRGEVRFEVNSGTVTVGGTWLGEVPVGSKEYHLLRCLAQQLDRIVPYADIKHFVVRHTGSNDSADEAGFCQDLKRRTKQKIPEIDQLITTTNRGEGYRLRGWAEVKARRDALAGRP